MLQYSSKYDPTIHEELDKADWATIRPKVLKYAVYRAKNLQWLGDEVEPEELVNESVARAYGKGARGGYRNWDKEKCPDLASFLIGIIRSMTSHMAEHEKDFPSESFFNEDGSAKDAKILRSCDDFSEVSTPPQPQKR
ncbi:MAG: hypothetical protein SVO01_01390 [Thermotogota bacterium]|nr:hypothetical protein [Thermotogota bacterium]